MHSYLADDNHVEKKAKDTKECVIKREINFQDYKECLENNKAIRTSKQTFKSDAHSVFT